MISVIVTVFEQAASLIPLLYCLRAQDIEEPYEILICDDGSSSDLFCAVTNDANLSTLDLRFIWQAKNGYRVARSRNNGIRCAKGDLLVLIDADILVRQDFLRKHRSYHSQRRQIVSNPRLWLLESGPIRPPFDAPVPEGETLILKLATLAKTNMSAMFDLLDDVSIDGDGPGQRNLSRSSPWMAVFGCSFSVGVDTCGLRFDENFEGWGPEDREFVLRLVENHNYKVLFCDDIVVYHLTAWPTGRYRLPSSHEKIVAFLRNMLYFRDLHPQKDLSLSLESFGAFYFDRLTQRWELHPKSSHRDSVATEEQILFVEEWLRDRCLYPTMACLP